MNSFIIRLWTVKIWFAYKANNYALLKKLRMIEYRFLGNGLRYRIHFGYVFFSPRGIFSTTSVKKFKKAEPETYGLWGLILPQPSG